MLYTKAQVSRPKLKAKSKSKAPSLKAMPWINAKAVFSVSLTVFTLEGIYIQSKSPFQNPKSPIYNAINLSLPFTTLCFYLKPRSPIYNLISNSVFNNIPLSNSSFKKHLGLTLDIKLNYSEYIKSITKKVSKTMGLSRKFQQILPR